MAERKVYTPATRPSAARPSLLKEKPKAALSQSRSKYPLFEKENYIWMGIGIVVVAIGMILMSGGKNQDANQFDFKLVYSTTRITIAPILILAGLMIEIYAIFKRPKAQQKTI